MTKLIILLLSLLVVGAGSFFLFQKNYIQKSPSPTPTSTPTPTPISTPTPTPTATPTPLPKATSKPTAKPTTAPVVSAATGGSFTCTLFIGYSQTNNWFPVFHSIGGQKYEMKWNGGGAAHYWSDSSYSGWDQSIAFPCAQNRDTPDRLVLDITHDAYLNQDPADMASIIRAWIATAKNKYPSAKQIVIQPVTGGPNHSTCQFNGKDVRASINHPFILQAVNQVVGGDVVRGNESQVSNCSQYADDIGHLNGDGQSVVGAQNANFFK